MGEPTMQTAVGYLTSLGGFGVLTVFCWLWFTGKIVTRRELDAAKAEAKEWKDIAFRFAGNNERMQKTNERTTDIIADVVRSNA